MSSVNKRGGFWRGFRYALHGIWLCVKAERNFRFHLAVAAYVLGFAPHFSLSRAEWAILCLTIGAVLCAELINSALERAVDRVSEELHPLSGAAKDLCAAAVLVLAVAAVAVGLFLFLKPVCWLAVFRCWRVEWWRPCALLCSFVPAWLFVFKWR